VKSFRQSGIMRIDHLFLLDFETCILCFAIKQGKKMAEAEPTNRTANQHEQVFEDESTSVGKTEANIHDIDMSKDQEGPANNREREAYHGKLIHSRDASSIHPGL
jgi:hypothetical protein